MSSFDRVLFVLFTLAVMVMSAYVFGVANGFLGPVAALVSGYLYGHELEVSLAALLMFLLAIRLLYQSILPAQNRQQAGFVHESELGQIKISLSALEQIVLQVVQAERSVRRAQVQLQVASGGGVIVRVKVATAGQQNLVELARSLQGAISQQVEKVTSVSVRDVLVLFSAVGNEHPRPL